MGEMKQHMITSLMGATAVALSLPVAAGTVAYDNADGTTALSASPVSSADWSPMLQRGTQELSIGGQLHIEDFDEIEYDLRLKYGWFIRDRWEVGLAADLIDYGDTKMINLGAFTEYNFNTNSRWVPYIGAAAKWADASTDNLDQNSVLFSGELGVKYFIRPHMAVFAAINFEWSPDEIFDIGDDIADNAENILIGMRFYF
jgi:hypothetical protein